MDPALGGELAATFKNKSKSNVLMSYPASFYIFIFAWLKKGIAKIENII